MKRFTAAVIGLGNIGMLYDYHLNHQTHLWTHAATYQFHPGFELVGAVDTDNSKQKMFTDKYNMPSFSSVNELLNNYLPDVVSICTPFHQQSNIFFELLEKYTPRAIIFEKPLAGSVGQAEKVVKILQQKNILSVVNYLRRFEPGAQKMVQLLQSGEIGQLKNIIGWYSNSMTSNGCHIVDLIDCVFSQKNSHSSFHSFKVDKNQAHIKMICNETPLHLFLAPQNYQRFDIQFVGTMGIIHYLHNGKEIKVHKVQEDSKILSLKVLDDVGTHIPNDINRYQWYTHDALYQALMTKRCLASTAQTALITEHVISKICEYQ